MAATHRQKSSPLLVKSSPPSLVVDQFRYPVNEEDLRRAASAHLADAGRDAGADDREGADSDAVDAKLAAIQRELRQAASPIRGDRDR